MSGLLKNWIDESDENARLLAQESLILDASERILEEMERKGISKSQLAGALGKTKAYVTQLLSGGRNMTLRSFADIAFALGMTAKVQLAPKLPYGAWEEQAGFTCVRVSKHLWPADDVVDLKEKEWNTVQLEQAA